MRRGVGRAAPSNLPVPKASRGSPATSSSSLARGRTPTHARSAEDLSNSFRNSPPAHSSALRRALSPGSSQNKGLSLSSARASHSGSPQPGVRYITEELIRKLAKEENLEAITSLNLTLSKDGGKKIKFIENLDRLKKLVSLNLSYNMIERMEKLEKLQHLRELNLSHNCIVRIECLETLTGLQVLNLSSNSIDHIPVWLPKRLQALRTFRIANNRITSLSEMAKLKTIPDLIHIDVKGNPLSELPHARLFLIFHLRCMETLDSQAVTSLEREQAQSRFALDEVQNLERQLEQEESRYKQLEESHNRSEQERSQQEVSQNQLLQRQRDIKEQLQQLQRELVAKDDLLKRKTTELNRACEKHYQLEQELAFYKIDSKFKDLGKVPPPAQDLSSDDGGLLAESPYIGRARYQANQMAEEGQVQAVPQRVQMHSVRAPAPVPPALSPQQREQLQARLDAELEAKKKEVIEAESRLQALQLDLNSTEQKLISAAQELKKLAPARNTPEPFRDDKFKIRQLLAKKMQNVNKLRDAATGMEDEIDRVQQSLTLDQAELIEMKNEIQSLSPQTSSYTMKKKQMADKELQVNGDHDAVDHLQQELQAVMQNIARETTEIKHLEEQLESDETDKNESIKAELEDIVSGLQGYLEGVKGQSAQYQQEYSMMMKEKELLEEKIRRLEAELSILDTEAQNAKVLQKQLEDAERELNKTQNLSQNLQDDLLRSRQKDLETQSRLEQAEVEIRRLNQGLQEAEKKAQSEKKSVERQLQAERERMEKMTQRVQDANRQDLEVKKLVAQLEAAKALNSSLRDQLEDIHQQKNQQENGFKPSELKKRLVKFTHDFKTNKGPGEPVDKDDILGTSFKEIYQAAQDKLNKSIRESEDAKKQKTKLEAEVQTLKEKVKRTEVALREQDNKENDEEKRQLQEEIKRLQASLKQIKEGGVPVRIVYAPSDGSGDRASSLDSEEKLLFDELQRELMELKRHMRQQEHDASHRLAEVETEAAQWQEEMKEQKRRFEKELDRRQQEADLLKEKQEARIQVIAQDLDQAQIVAEALQQALNQREEMLQDELGAADMSNQMITAQEEELSRLYGILEAQRGEIENLNQMLDYLATQGPDGVGPAFDDELWRIRQEVNKLKETLAMQSAYVQAMPTLSHFGTQAGLPPPLLHSTGIGSSGIGVGHVGSNVLVANPSTRSSFGAGGTGMVVQNGSRPGASQPATSGFATGVQFPGYPMPLKRPEGELPFDQPDGGRQSAAFRHRQAFRTRPGSALLSQGSDPTADPRAHFSGHLGNERRETKTPPGSRTTTGKSEQSSPVQQQAFSSDRVLPANGIGHQAATPLQRAVAAPSSAFEPVHRPDRQSLASTVPPFQAAFAPPAPHTFFPPSVSLGTQPPNVAPQPSGRNAGGLGGFGLDLNAGPMGRTGVTGPSRGNQTSGAQGPSRNVQAMVAAPAGNFGDHLVAHGGTGSGNRTQPTVIHVPVPVYVGAPSSSSQPTAQPPTAVPPGPTAAKDFVGSGTGFGSGYQPHVAFDPVTTQYSYSDGGSGVPPAQSGVVYPFLPQGALAQPGVYSIGTQTYVPAGPVQQLTYQPARVYMPVGADGGQNARVYYPAVGPILTPAPGAQPPQPALPVTLMGPPSPGPHPALVPVTPIATGTPVRVAHAVPANFDGSYATAPPSPIRAVPMESPSRGILKNRSGGDRGGGVGDDGDDSYLFCNVPEHHDLEDYIAELQEKLRHLKAKLLQEKSLKEEIVVDNDRKLMKRLLNELEDRREELEGLDLAIERQKRNLKEMKEEEKGLKRKKCDAREELEKLRDKNIRRLLKIKHGPVEDSTDEEMERSRQRHLHDELDCLERTLAKRQTQLREAERALKECNADLKEVREQARGAVKRYDDAAVGLQNAVSDQQEIDRRANEVGLQLVQSVERLAQAKVDLRDLERKRQKQERLLKDINQVIAKKDTEFQELDAQVKVAQHSLQKIQDGLTLSTQREKEVVEALRDSEDVLGKRRAEIARMRDQVETQRSELERLDQLVGRKRTELQLLQESQERRQAELNSVLRQAETDVAAKQREIKDEQAHLEQLEVQKTDVGSVLKARRAELHKIQEEVQQEEEVLQRLTSSVNKNKSELKHTYEMQKLEQNELENLRTQHAQKMADLERIQRDLLEEKSDLEQLNAETSRKGAELERLRQAADRERTEVDSLSSEKQLLEDRISNLLREKGALEENCKSLDDKLNTLKRTQRITEEKLEASTHRLEVLEQELGVREREMDESNLQRTVLQKDLQMLKQNVKDTKLELEQLQNSISDAETTLRNLDHDIRNSQQKHDEMRLEVQRLAEAIRHSNAACEEASREERAKHEELQDLIRAVADREREHEDARKAVNRMRKEIEKEENKLNKLVTNANANLEQIRSDMVSKQEELDKTSQALTQLKNEAREMHANGEQLGEMQIRIQELETEMEERNKEKNELAKALSVSYEEVQRLRKESAEAQELMRKEQYNYENTLSDIQQQLEQKKQELQQLQQRSAAQVVELQSIAEQQFRRANTLKEQLDTCRQNVLKTKMQQDSASGDKENECMMQKATAVLAQAKENEHILHRATVVLAQDKINDDWTTRHGRLRQRLVEEQDYLRLQLKQQMLRHNEVMESARRKSDETINHLKRKLNSLQEILFNSGTSDVQALQDLARSRSQSPRCDRRRSPSPITRTGSSYLTHRPRSRSFERISTSMIPERDCV